MRRVALRCTERCVRARALGDICRIRAPLHSYINNVILMHTAHNLAACAGDAYAYTRDPGLRVHMRATPKSSPGGHVCRSSESTRVRLTASPRARSNHELKFMFEVARRHTARVIQPADGDSLPRERFSDALLDR